MSRCAPIERGAAGLLLASELRLVLRGRPLWWWAVLAVSAVVQVVAPAEAMAGAVVVAWMVSLDVFGRSLLRERDTRTADLVMTAPRAATRLLAARTAVALLLAIGPVLPAMLRMAMQTPPAALPLLATAALVALSGLALSAACRSPRPYELAMAFCAYLGVMGMGPLAFQSAAPVLSAAVAGLVPVCAAVLVLAWPWVNRRGLGLSALRRAAKVREPEPQRVAG